MLLITIWIMIVLGHQLSVLGQTESATVQFPTTTTHQGTVINATTTAGSSITVSRASVVSASTTAATRATTLPSSPSFTTDQSTTAMITNTSSPATTSPITTTTHSTTQEKTSSGSATISSDATTTKTPATTISLTTTTTKTPSTTILPTTTTTKIPPKTISPGSTATQSTTKNTIQPITSINRINTTVARTSTSPVSPAEPSSVQPTTKINNATTSRTIAQTSPTSKTSSTDSRSTSPMTKTSTTTTTMSTTTSPTTTTKLNACLSSPCRRGWCYNDVGDFICLCPQGYKGKICDQQESVESTNRPEAVKIWPTVGPQAGGTNITISHLSGIQAVFLTNAAVKKKCTIIERSADYVIAQTPPYDKTGILQIRIQLDVGSWWEDGSTFEYKPNPSINDIEPMVSLVGGGTNLTISGSSLDAVASPKIWYSVENCNKPATSNIFVERCAVRTENDMLCATPNISRCVYSKTISALDSAITDPPSVPRELAQSDGSDVDVIAYLEIVGFVLDGDARYKDLSQTDMSHLRELRVYNQPSINTSKEVIKYNKDVPLIMKGRHMLRGNSLDDYSVYVGAELCTIESLTDDSLMCKPPDSAPKKVANSTSEHYAITIHLGNYLYHYGEMSYPLQLDIIIIITVFVVIIVAMIIIVPAVVCHRSGRCRRQRNKEESEQNIYTADSTIQMPPVPVDWRARIENSQDNGRPQADFSNNIWLSDIPSSV